MNSLLTTNTILVACLTSVLGKALTTMIPKEKAELRRTLIPLLLCLFGVGLMVLICFLNHQTNYGDAIVNGLTASAFSQFIYNYCRESLKKKKLG